LRTSDVLIVIVGVLRLELEEWLFGMQMLAALNERRCSFIALHLSLYSKDVLEIDEHWELFTYFNRRFTLRTGGGAVWHAGARSSE